MIVSRDAKFDCVEYESKYGVGQLFDMQYLSNISRMKNDNKKAFTNDECVKNINTILENNKNKGGSSMYKSITLGGTTSAVYGIDITGRLVDIEPHPKYKMSNSSFDQGIYFDFDSKGNSEMKDAKYEIPKKGEPICIYPMGLVVFNSVQERTTAIEEFGNGDPMLTAHLYLSGVAKIPNGGYSTIQVLSRANHQYYMVIGRNVISLPLYSSNKMESRIQSTAAGLSNDDLVDNDILIHRTDIVVGTHIQENVTGNELCIKVSHESYKNKKDTAIFTKTGLLIFTSKEQATEFVEKYDCQYERFLEDRVADNMSEDLFEELEHIRKEYKDMNKDLSALVTRTLASTAVAIGIEKAISSIADNMKKEPVPPVVADKAFRSFVKYTSGGYTSGTIGTVLKSTGKLVLIIGITVGVVTTLQMAIDKYRKMNFERKIRRVQNDMNVGIHGGDYEKPESGPIMKVVDKMVSVCKLIYTKIKNGFKRFGSFVRRVFDPTPVYLPA